MNPTIMVVEDNPKIGRLLLDYLHAEGYRTRLLDDGSQVIEAVRRDSPDLLLLDLMLPGTDGLEICRGIRRFSQLPIIMITARIEEVDRLRGLDSGADDYICKPFSPREVMARVKAVLRRAMPRQALAEDGYGPFSLDTDKREVRIDDKLLQLTPNEYKLLAHLLHNPGRVFSREQLITAVYQDHRAVSDRSVDSHIKNLRKKIAVHLPGRDVIISIYSVGYKLEGRTQV